MLTSLGKFYRKLRIDNDELLKHMAERLGVSSSYLSAVESGKRDMPDSWEAQIIDLYDLSEEMILEFQYAIRTSKRKTTIDMTNFVNSDKLLVESFARKFSALDDATKKKLERLLK